MNQKMNCTSAKQIDIISFLSSIGLEPVRIRGNSHWYRSPYREEKTASFKVDACKNSWFDFGDQKGGNLIDLGILIYQCSISQLLEILSGSVTAEVTIYDQQSLPLNNPEERKLNIVKTTELSNPVLNAYLWSRGIPVDIAKKYCKRADFKLYGKSYYAIGFQNRSGGYELRNAIHKLSSSPKDISLIINGSRNLKVYEGFMDFLSGVAIHPKDECRFDHLILNTTGFAERAIPLISEYDNSFLYLDHNPAGRKAVARICDQCKNSADESLFYQGKGDLNDYWVSQVTGKEPKRL